MRMERRWLGPAVQSVHWTRQIEMQSWLNFQRRTGVTAQSRYAKLIERYLLLFNFIYLFIRLIVPLFLLLMEDAFSSLVLSYERIERF